MLPGFLSNCRGHVGKSLGQGESGDHPMSATPKRAAASETGSIAVGCDCLSRRYDQVVRKLQANAPGDRPCREAGRDSA